MLDWLSSGRVGRTINMILKKSAESTAGASFFTFLKLTHRVTLGSNPVGEHSPLCGLLLSAWIARLWFSYRFENSTDVLPVIVRVFYQIYVVRL